MEHTATPNQTDDETREPLGSNLGEMEDWFEGTEWREQFEARPYAFLGAAFVGGLALAALVGRMPAATQSGASHAGRGVQDRPGWGPQVGQLWEDVQHALFGVASARLTGYLSDLVPGFAEHYRRPGSER